MSANFIESALAGEILEPEKVLQEEIARWHDSPEELGELHSWLGMTWDEYALWVEKPLFLRAILAARHQGTSLKEIVAASEPGFSLAARGVAKDELAKVGAWLKQTGRL